MNLKFISMLLEQIIKTFYRYIFLGIKNKNLKRMQSYKLNLGFED